jgi:membrane protease YdiL (CAAX protease family)
MKNFYQQSMNSRNSESKFLNSKIYNYGLIFFIIPFILIILSSIFYTLTLKNLKIPLLQGHYAGIAFVFLYALIVEKRKPKTFGFIGYPAINYIIFTVAALIVFLIPFMLTMMAAGFPKLELNSAINIGALLSLGYYYIIQSLTEELFFRGLAMQALLRFNRKKSFKTNMIIAIVLSSIGFTLIHLQIFTLPVSLMIPSALGLFFAGTLLAVIAIRYGMLAAFGFHFGWNYINAIIGLPVSGSPADTATSIFKIPSDFFKNVNPIISGGEFGLEASYALLITLAVLTVIVFKSIIKKEKTN